jgi:hypothetical protein
MATYAIAPWTQYLDRASGVRREMTVRNLCPGELLPSNLPHELPPNFISPQPDWIWLAESYSEPVAMLIAAPAQNLAYLMRICASADSPSTRVAALMLLLRTAFRDMRLRGYLGYIVNLELRYKECAKLLKIAQRAARGKAVVVNDIILLGGSTDIGEW